MITTIEELNEKFNAGQITMDLQGHQLVGSPRYFLDNFSGALLFREMHPELCADVACFGHGQCQCCGAHIYMNLVEDDTKIILDPRINGGTKPCSAPNALTEEFSIELDCPSGEFILFNDLRNDPSGKEIFPDPEDNDQSDIDYDLSSLAGIKNTTQAYAAMGMGFINLGNTSPSVLQESTTKLIIASFDEDDENIKLPPSIGSICTDLWWYCIIDRAMFESKFKMTPKQYQKAYKATGAWPKLIIAKMTPGRYTISSRKHLVDEYESIQIFSTVELKG